MVLPENAIDAVQVLVEKVTDFKTSEFFLENNQYLNLTGGTLAMIDFLLARPAMLLTDAQNMEGILSFIDKEWYEAEHAENAEASDNLYKELGDTMFFSLLAGVLHWEDMDSDQRAFVRRAIEWSSEKAAQHNMNANEAVIDVATKKDPTNYRQEFYQLIEGEKTKDIVGRVVPIGKLHRKIREKLNGEWAQTGNLLIILARHWLEGNEKQDVSVMQIEAMFELAGLDLIVILENN